MSANRFHSVRRDKVFRDREIAELYEHKTFRRTGLPKRFYLTPALLQILDRAQALHVLRGIKCDYVFPRRANQKASNWLAKTWNAVRKRAGVDIQLRDFRSGFINLADDAGMSEQQVAELTQHASLQTIRRHYRAVKDKRASANAIIVSDRLRQFRGMDSGLVDSSSDVFEQRSGPESRTGASRNTG